MTAEFSLDCIKKTFHRVVIWGIPKVNLKMVINKNGGMVILTPFIDLINQPLHPPV